MNPQKEEPNRFQLQSWEWEEVLADDHQIQQQIGPSTTNPTTKSTTNPYSHSSSLPFPSGLISQPRKSLESNQTTHPSLH